MRVTNQADISLPLAVWLLHDEYDYIDKPNYISATSLMKPLRQIILPARVPPEKRTSDVQDYIARALGHSIHDSIQRAWETGKDRPLKLLGYSQEIIDRIVVNPTPEQLQASNEMIPMYFEQRAFRDIEVNGTTYTIGGKFDLVADGIVNDFKSTSVFSWVKGTKDDDYALQGSIYRWLNPDKITEDYIRINFIFTDWSKAMLRTPNYPQKRVEYKDIPLLSLADTEAWIRKKVALVQANMGKPESEIPECTDTELWRSEPQFKYFTDPAKAKDPTARATRNFPDLVEARKFQAEKGGKGAIVMKPGEPKACGYCQAFEACSQKDRLGLGSGSIPLNNDVMEAVFGS